MHNIDSALIYALIALFQMASSNKDSWVQDLRKLICTNHGHWTSEASIEAAVARHQKNAFEVGV